MGQPSTFRVVLSGEIDLLREPELTRVVAAFRVSPDKDVEIDLSAVTFMDSTGLAALNNLRKIALRRNGVATLVDPPRGALRVLRIVGFEHLFAVRRTDRRPTVRAAATRHRRTA